MQNVSSIRCRVRVALAAALVAGGCSDVILPDGCGGSSFDVNVTAAQQRTRPTYRWDAGQAFELRVARASDPIFAAWRIAADEPDIGFASPVDHGTVPAGATFIDGGEPTLSTGVTYCVAVTLVDGREGTSEFQP